MRDRIVTEPLELMLGSAVLAEAKGLVDRITLPDDAHLVDAYETFFHSTARLVA